MSDAPVLADPADDLHAVMADYAALIRAQDPIRAATRGDVAAARLWPDDSPAAVTARRRTLEALSARLAPLGNAALSEADALDRDILADRIGVALQGFQFDEERMPFVSGEGFFTNPDYAATLTLLHTPEDAEAWLARLDAIPAYYATEIANMRRGVATHFTQPRSVVERTIASVRAQTEVSAADAPLLGPLAKLPDTIPQAQRAAYRARGAEIYERRVLPALRDLLHFFETDYLPHARRDIGIRAVPNGERYYAYLVRKHTTTAMTPAEIHALGVREVARIRGEMERAMADAGFHGAFADFNAFLRSDAQFRAANADALIAYASEVTNRINFQLPRYFGTLPRNTYAVVFMPEALEGGSSGYWEGNPTQGVPGQVLLRRGSATHTTLYDMPAWLAHEGTPGHHTQIALAEEMSGLPEYRRNGDITAYVEGWALYAERLAGEMGIYRTPYERFGRLSMEMWRACRLVMDTGMHVMGWTREQAEACLADNGALSAAAIPPEVDRYIGWPGQALAYKIGELEIDEIRAGAEQRLGACFDIRRFHDAVLRDGAVPLSILRRRMRACLDAETAACSAAAH